MMRWPRLLPLLWLLSACNVASVREAPNTIAYNQCQSSAECGGGVCTAAGQCRSRSATFQTMLFEVTPPADWSVIAGVQFLVPKEELGAGESDVSLVLDPIAQIAGRITAKERKCTLKFVNESGVVVTTKDKSVPARVSLVPTSTTLGLYSPRAVTQSALVNAVYWSFSLNVPPGKYDIYVEPNPQQDESCPLPPQLVRGKGIADGGMLSFDIDLPEPSAFELHVTWPPEDGALDGWTVDMLDPVSGRVISNRVRLGLQKGSKSDYVAMLSYSSVTIVGETSPKPQDPLFRLSPPEGSPPSAALPTVLMARSALAVFDATSGTLSDFTSLPTPVHVHGQVTSGDAPAPVAASITLVAKELPDIAPGVLASFVRTVSAGPDGQFDVYLLPGKYSVSTVPESSLNSNSKTTPLAADIRGWTVAKTPAEQAGKVIDLGSALLVTGKVLASNGAVATAQVQAVASPQSIQSHPLQDTLDGSTDAPLRAAFIPRASAGDVDGAGDFAFRTDPGTFDITVRPNTDTGFPWLVRPGYTINNLSAALGQINMPLAVSYHGTVTVPGLEAPKVIPSALVRAYVYLKGNEYTAQPLEADSVLQVAETRADQDGAFDILIPAELNRPD